MVPGAVKKQQNVRIVRCWSRCDINAVMSDLEAAPWSAMESFDDIDDSWGYWKSVFLKILDSHLPLRKVHMRSQTSPWISNDVRKLMRTNNNCCAMAKNGQLDEVSEIKESNCLGVEES